MALIFAEEPIYKSNLVNCLIWMYYVLYFLKKNLNVSLQTFGDEAENEILLGLSIENSLGTGEKLTESLRSLLIPHYPNLEIRRIETVGPRVGDELKADALLAIAIALSLVLVYVTLRFQWRFGVSSIICLLHDIIAVVGMFSLFNKEFNLAIVAALLTVVGYSLNDTIVVFDRVRENLAKYRKKTLIEVINLSINETLARTILTSLTTLLVIIVFIFIWWGNLFMILLLHYW